VHVSGRKYYGGCEAMDEIEPIIYQWEIKDNDSASLI
jgi:glycine/serine hydroxymethyltransferase